VAASDDRPRRFPRSLYSVGSEPDPRYSLANERTFLAWISTGLGLLAAGVALDVLGNPIDAGLRHAAAVVLVSAGLLAPVQAWVGWWWAERAMRLRRPLPAPLFALPLGLAVAAAAVLVLIGLQP